MGNPGAGSEFAGQTLKAVFDGQGKLVDVKVPESMANIESAVRTMLATLAGTMPKVPMAVGDTAVVLLNIPVPLQLPGSAPGQPMLMDTRNVFKLTGITRDGSDQIAQLAQTTEATLTTTLDLSAMTGSALSADVELKMTGTGTTEVNVDKGFIRTMNLDSVMDMTMRIQGMTIKLVGNSKTTITGK